MAERFMHSISDISANKIKEITKLHQKKYRDESGLFIAEGKKALEEFLTSDVEIVEIYALKGLENVNSKLPVKIIDEKSMKKISTTSSVCEVLTVAKKKIIDLKKFQTYKKIVLLDEISDPGNLGTIIRSAAAFNVDGIILFGNCTDVYSSKVIRSTAGNFFKTPIVEIKSIDELKQNFPSYKLIATALSKENNIEIKDCNKYDKYIVMFGSEDNGLRPELTKIAERNIKIEMSKNVESLNLSVSVSVILYELFKN